MGLHPAALHLPATGCLTKAVIEHLRCLEISKHRRNKNEQGEPRSLLFLSNYFLVEFQNLSGFELSTLLQVVQLHDGVHRCATLAGDRVECLTLANLVEA